MESNSLLQRIGQIAINAKDVPRASAFYRDVLGVQHLFDAGPKLSFFNLGGVRLMLTTAEKPEFDHPSSILYLVVVDIEAAFASLKGKGVAFDDEPHLVAKMPDHELWMAFFRDSEGNLLALMCEKR
jgi:methylmalonyl-CoA/ethylmalonyl-CoA epimerase